MKADPRKMKVPASGRAPMGNKKKSGKSTKGAGHPSPKKGKGY